MTPNVELVTDPTERFARVPEGYKLTDDEMRQVVCATEDDARIWFDDPRSWPTLYGFVGFRIAAAVFRYRISGDQYVEFVRLMFERVGPDQTRA